MTGTIYQIANYLGVKQSTVKFYSMPTYLKRDKGNRKRVIKLKDEIKEILEDVKRHLDYVEAIKQASIRDNEIKQCMIT